MLNDNFSFPNIDDSNEDVVLLDRGEISQDAESYYGLLKDAKQECPKL